MLWSAGAKYVHKRDLLQHAFNAFPAVDAGNHTVSSASLTAGRYTLVAFVSATCPHCREELKSLAAIQPQFKDHLNIVVLSPSDGRDVSSLRTQYPTLSIYRIGRSAFDATGLAGFPELLFIHNGIVTGLQQGERAPDEQAEALNRFMGEAR
jgi:thiol-disulfide isomerase/thioredoxin